MNGIREYPTTLRRPQGELDVLVAYRHEWEAGDSTVGVPGGPRVEVVGVREDGYGEREVVCDGDELEALACRIEEYLADEGPEEPDYDRDEGD